MTILKCPEIRFKNDDGNNYPNWEDKKLDNVFKFYKGKGISKIELSEEGIPCIIYGELYTKYREVIGVVKSKTNIKKELLFMSEIGDILIPSSGETQKDIATASTVMEKNVALGGDINILRSKETINSPYVSYYLKHIKNIEISKLSQGNSVVHLYSKQLSNLKIEIPSLEEQQKIGDFFMLLDKRIEQQEEKIALLKDYKKAMIQRIFSQKIRFKDQNGNDYPDWEEKKLGEMIYRSSKKNTDQKYDRIQSISNKYGFVNQEDYFQDRRVGSLNVSNYYVINKGCFAYNPSRIDVGSLAYKHDNDISIISPLYVSFKGNTKHINDKFLLGWLFSHKFVGKLGRLFEGSVRNTLSYENLSTIDIETPCIAEQEKIALFLEVINDSIENQKELLDEIIKEKTALLNRMFI